MRSTCYAIQERLSERKQVPYAYTAPSEKLLEEQRRAVITEQERGEYEGIRFSIIVPTYRTAPHYLRELIHSVQAQSYPFWELILADATEDESVRKVVEEYMEECAEERDAAGEQNAACVRYIRLSRNAGISGNTNGALAYAECDYIGLLDHDDILAPDALFEMAEAIRRARAKGCTLQLIYSDEDKCNGEGTAYYEPNRKEKFNYDLILSNNYVCHFMVMERSLIQRLQLRPEYDGAQDYDLILRAVTALGIPRTPSRESLICHVPKVLYHWRCHSASTAENPHSKEYAYEAGRRALQAHLDQNNIRAEAVCLKHVGFYQVRYAGNMFFSEGFCESLFSERPDLGAVGGAVTAHGKIVGGRMDAEGCVYYEGLSVHHSGYLHRAVLTQDAEAADIRCIALREELWQLFRDVTGVDYQCKAGEEIFDAALLPDNVDYRELSLKLCRAISEQGYRILWCRREDE